jgi:hypothetical protein
VTPVQDAEQVSAGLDLTVSLTAALESHAAALTQQKRDRDRMFADVSYMEPPAITTAILPYATPADSGPKHGFWWAVQRVVVAGFGATTDVVTAYRGSSAADVVPQNALFTFTIPVAGAVSTWHPGRTGCILARNRRLVFAGTFTGTLLVASYDVIQVTDEHMPALLL